MPGTFRFRSLLAIGGALILMSTVFALSALGQPSLLSQKDGGVQGDEFGYAVSGAGDVNGDGTPDYIIGAAYADPGGLSSAGSVSVYSGANGALLYQKTGTAASMYFGAAVSGAGDVNGDGKADFIIASTSQAYVYSGATGALLYQKAGGGQVAGAGDVNGDGRSDFIVSDLNQSYVYSGATGALLYQKLGGTSVAGVGDIDGDGKADFLVGDQYADPGFTNGGSVYVYSGATGALLYQKNGAADYDLFGSSAAGAGDVNGDGRPDFIVGARLADVGGTINCGAGYVFSGANGALLYQKTGPASEQWGYAVAGAGDVDGDGKADFLVTSLYANSSAGAAMLYSGASGSLITRINGVSSTDNLGYDAAAIGDINGNGKSDFLVSAPLTDPSLKYDAGSVYIYGATGGTVCNVAAQFAASSTSGTAPAAINFTDQSTGSPTAWSWSFGDGTTSTAQNPSHTYSAAGTYTVSLTVTAGTCNNTNTKASYITVTAPVCAVVAQFSASATNGTAPLAVTFTDLSTGSPTAWNWNFGDGTTSTLRSPSHTFSTVGSFTVTLTASAGSCSSSKSATISVTAPVCAVVAGFTASATSGTVPVAISFTDQSSGSPTAWSWNFGDGATSTLQNPSHTYSVAGTYSVSLTATSGTCNNTNTKTNYITVSAPPVSTTMHVAGLMVSEEYLNRKYRGKATLTVVDANNLPVSGATVTGNFSGPNGSVKSATTGATGEAILYSDVTKKTQNFCFTVSSVVKTGCTYDATISVTYACESTPVSISLGTETLQAADVSLDQNYPNPFNPRTEISYNLPVATHVTIEIYNVLGQKVVTLADEVKEAGSHTVSWDASGNASGIYFYRLTTTDFTTTKKMLLLK